MCIIAQHHYIVCIMQALVVGTDNGCLLLLSQTDGSELAAPIHVSRNSRAHISSISLYWDNTVLLSWHCALLGVSEHCPTGRIFIDQVGLILGTLCLLCAYTEQVMFLSGLSCWADAESCLLTIHLHTLVCIPCPFTSCSLCILVFANGSCA